MVEMFKSMLKLFKTTHFSTKLTKKLIFFGRNEENTIIMKENLDEKY